MTTTVHRIDAADRVTVVLHQVAIIVAAAVERPPSNRSTPQKRDPSLKGRVDGLALRRLRPLRLGAASAASTTHTATEEKDPHPRRRPKIDRQATSILEDLLL
jgi:hypothetical protein